MVNGERIKFSIQEGEGESSQGSAPSKAGHEVRSDLPGKILQIHVQEGASVSAGDLLLTMEALKMEIEVTAAVGGVVGHLAVSPQAQVNSGDLLLSIG